MKCTNIITIAHYKNGKDVIEGSAEIMIPRIKRYNLDLSINGYFTHEECGGKLLPLYLLEISELSAISGVTVVEFPEMILI